MERIDAALPSSLDRAVQLLRQGEIVAYPTETVYGLGVDPFNVDALERLFAAKGRAREKAILLIVDSLDQLDGVTTHIPTRAKAMMESFWPGPLSILLPKHPKLPEAIAPGLDRICVRCPGSAIARQLCSAFGGPLTSTSANASGEEAVLDLADLHLPGVALGLDGGRLPASAPSTIVDGVSGAILREGAIGRDQLAGH